MKHGCKTATFAAGVLSGLYISVASAADLNIADMPLFLPGAVAPLNMIVMGRDHKLYYEAYNDRSDLNGGGVDVGYKPNEIEYFGYFDSRKCYSYDAVNFRFVPESVTADKTCVGQWSGDWLNWATMARIDALNKVLFGGFRRVDTATDTVLERTHIPQDAHSWVKEYRSIAIDGYDIANYTPYSEPTAGLTHLFANVSLMFTDRWTTNGPIASPPLLRVAQNVARNPDVLATDPGNRAWNWASTESPVAGACYGRDGGNDGKCSGASADAGSGVLLSANTSAFTDLRVRVEVCKTGLLESNCRQYPSGNYKPIGLLQEYGENDAMRFGLLTGSYWKSKSGGVLRKAIDDLDDEINIDTDGTFKNFNGIIATLSKLRAAGYKNYRSVTAYGATGLGAGVQYMTTQTSSLPSGSGLVTTRPFNEPEFGGMWGNPVGEMMYEALRYFSGAAAATAAFDYSGTTTDSRLGLPKATWDDPYDSASLACAKPFMTVISDINTSYDTDQLPGKYFSGTAPSDDLGGLDVTTEADAIWNAEIGGTRDIFIGQSGATLDGAPSPKSATSFGNIRGLSPEEPTKEGGYYAASVAKYGFETDLHTATGEQKVQTFAVALASPLPRIEIPVAAGRTVTLVPFAKSVAGNGPISAAPGQFQPTNQIVDFYVETMASDYSSGSFLINFEDVESGNDHDMDAVVRYRYAIVGSDVQVDVERLYEQGSITHHMGYTISGTTADGTYLVVQDDASDVKYFVDTPAGVASGGCASSPYCATRPASPQALPWSDSRLFTPGSSTAATLLKDPLWYAAKWGGFEDSNANDRPDLQAEWDANSDGDPDNYFLVTNALTLGAQLRSAFDVILSRTASAAAVATNTTRLDTNTLIYQAQFRSDDWTGKLLAYRLMPNGTLGALQWDASAELPDFDDRVIFTRDGAVPGAGGGVPFTYDDIGATHQAALDQRPDATVDMLGADRIAWLRGDEDQEQDNGGVFRNRSAALGDIINSDPQFVGAQNFGYEALPVSTPGRDTYQTFRRTKINTATGAVLEPMVYVGANDGMLHGFDAATGIEHFAYVPSTLIAELNQLTQPNYSHRYFVDGQAVIGDAYIDRGGTDQWASVLVGTTGAGGKTVFALDVTRPHAFAETDVLWEFTDPDLGNPIGQPVVARMADGTWAAVFANGYNSTNQHAMLFVVNLETGALLRKIDTGVGTLAIPNGLGTPSLLADGTRTIQAAYAGDLYGNLWKFDLSNADPALWGVALSGSPLFTATDDAGVVQPITAPPEIGRHPNGGYMIYFGTGKFFEKGDNEVDPMDPLQPQHSFYGLWDKTAAPSAISYAVGDRESILTRQSIIYEGKPANSNFNVRVTTEEGTNWASARGWFIDLVSPVSGAQGERVVSLPLLRNGRVIFTTLVPSANPCEFGGGSWLMELEAVSGERLEVAPIDITEDGAIDSGDLVTITIINEDGDEEEISVPASAVESREGIIDTPAVVTTPDGNEIKVASGTSGNVEALRERGSGERLRGSWRQLR